ncbi:MAG: protease family protein [Kribbellaceae bacterium]|jgi:membrane protease YdiL (CAAX protease family)|nr:protease family protein [Kribbellaceae bacterium]
MAHDATPGRGSAPAVPVGDPQPYHRLLRNSRSEWWTPILGSLTILVGWWFSTFVILGIQFAIHRDPKGTVSWFGLLATNLSLAVLIPLSILVARQLNHQRPGLLSSVAGRLRWRALAWFALAALSLEVLLLAVVEVGGADLLGNPGGGPAKDAAAVIAVTLLTSTFQAAGEEYFFRGYLLQTVGSMVRSPLVAILITTVLFTMAHGILPWQSPALFLDRFAFGLVAAFLVVRTGGLEASIAAHAANNIVTFVFAALTNSVGDSLQATDAPWSLVFVDVGKFVAFGVIAILIARWQRLETTADPSVRLTPGPGPGVGPRQTLV